MPTGGSWSGDYFYSQRLFKSVLSSHRSVRGYECWLNRCVLGLGFIINHNLLQKWLPQFKPEPLNQLWFSEKIPIGHLGAHYRRVFDSQLNSLFFIRNDVHRRSYFLSNCLSGKLAFRQTFLASRVLF